MDVPHLFTHLPTVYLFTYLPNEEHLVTSKFQQL